MKSIQVVTSMIYAIWEKHRRDCVRVWTSMSHPIDINHSLDQTVTTVVDFLKGVELSFISRQAPERKSSKFRLCPRCSRKQ